MLASSFFFSLAFCMLLTPIMRIIALKLRIVDYPNTELKTHKRPIPYLGGLAIFAAVAVVLILQNDHVTLMNQYGKILGSLIILGLGLVDDIRPVSPVTKLIVQFIAAFIVGSSGISFSFFDNGILNLAVTILWIIGVSNAINLIDTMDGLAAGIVSICSLFFALLLQLSGDLFSSALMLALAGACLGFLIYNFQPARIYMGDTGSLLIGFLFACTVIDWTEGQEFGRQLIVPVFILGIPLFELIFVSVLRIKAGKSPLRGSQDHFALRLVKMGLSVKKTVLLAYAGAIILGTTALLILSFDAYGLAAAAFGLVCVAAYKLSQVNVS
ncbi:MraY family glycosyltransferase [Paenibacillus vulneris]|uniref:Glycosyltransferase family 4 protein n=1 Tax=Paenibacillus vulneris TaxID=1133364 RepID=A0ABW3UWS9_9BACL